MYSTHWQKFKKDFKVKFQPTKKFAIVTAQSKKKFGNVTSLSFFANVSIRQ